MFVVLGGMVCYNYNHDQAVDDHFFTFLESSDKKKNLNIVFQLYIFEVQ